MLWKLVHCSFTNCQFGNSFHAGINFEEKCYGKENEMFMVFKIKQLSMICP